MLARSVKVNNKGVHEPAMQSNSEYNSRLSAALLTANNRRDSHSQQSLNGGATSLQKLRKSKDFQNDLYEVYKNALESQHSTRHPKDELTTIPTDESQVVISHSRNRSISQNSSASLLETNS